ncbi:MAG: HAD hydrolase-like protein, partial [Rubrobacteraceae bacterium]
DCAAMLAAIEASTGARAEAIVGKPSPHMAATLLDRLGVGAGDTLLTGDRLATDIRMANEAGMASALVLTGATGLDEALRSEDRPDYVICHLGELLPWGDGSRATARDPDRGNE